MRLSAVIIVARRTRDVGETASSVGPRVVRLLRVVIVVRLLEVDLAVRVVRLAAVLVDMPDEQAMPRKVGVVAGLLPVLEQEVFAAGGAVDGNFQHRAVILDARQVILAFTRQRQDWLNPAQPDFRPGAVLRRGLAAVEPGTARHHAPCADARRRVVRIIQVGQPQVVAELVPEDPHRRPLALHRVAADAGPVAVFGRNRPAMRPDGVVTGGAAAAVRLVGRPRVDDNQVVEVAVAVTVEVAEVDERLRQRDRLAYQRLRVALRFRILELVFAVVGHVLAGVEPLWDDRSRDVELPVRVLVEEVPHRARLARKQQLLVVRDVVGAVGRVVGELDEQHQQVRVANPVALRQSRLLGLLVLRRRVAWRLRREVVRDGGHRRGLWQQQHEKRERQ